MAQQFNCDLSVYRDEISRTNTLSKQLKDIQCSLVEKIGGLEQQKKELEIASNEKIRKLELQMANENQALQNEINQLVVSLNELQKKKDDFETLLSEKDKQNKTSLNKTNELLAIEKRDHQLLKSEFDEYKYQNYLVSKSGLFNKMKYSWQRYWQARKSGKSLFLSYELANDQHSRVLLTDQPIWLEMDVSPGDKVDYFASVNYQNIIKTRNKALLLIQYIDASNEILKDVYGKIPFSVEKNANFYYLQDTQGESVKILSVTIPNQVVKIRLGFCSFYNFIDEYVWIASKIFCQRHFKLQEISNEFGFPEVEFINVTNQTENITISVKPAEQISLYGIVDYSNVTVKNDKKALILISYFDSENKRLENVYGKMPFSEQKQGNFRYLADSNGEVIKLVSLEIPEHACYLQVGISGFGLQKNETVGFSHPIFIYRRTNIKQLLVSSEVNKSVITSTNQSKSNQPKLLKAIKVAVILDEFSYNSFKDTFTPIIVEPNNWLEFFEKEKPDIFFCESAWSGVDSIKRPWQAQIYSSIKFNYENRGALIKIIDYCKKNRIPTVFWNKEDPTHYNDRVCDFVKTAQMFDYVFTTSQECVELYKTDYGLRNVYCLPFATNPKLFNPIEKFERTNDIIFAGSWYEVHKERCREMEIIFDAILDSGYNLVIYDRNYGLDKPLNKFPEKYIAYIRKNVPFSEIDKVYKGSCIGLNINTVVDSNTMFARRVFELISSNTFVVSNYSKGIEKIFGKNILFLDKNPQGLQKLNTNLIRQMQEENLNSVLSNHTYRNRFKEILNKINYIYESDDPTITVCCFIQSISDLLNAIEYFKGQYEISGKLLLILSDDITGLDIYNIYSKYNGGDVEVYSMNIKNNYIIGEYIPTTSHCAFVNYNLKRPFNFLSSALLHTAYLDDEMIMLSEGNRYCMSQSINSLNDVIVPSTKFDFILKNYNKSVNGSFYSLNQVVK